jgi:2-polyprenyl-3-methyl-5-hydroxy-6-metoxy-1,4-benzoquinol methylase
MSSVLIALGVLALCTIAAAIGARLLSRRRLLPCPASLRWILETRMMEGVAGGSALIERAGVHSNMKILDAGCGPGRLTIPLARRVGTSGKVVALDVQPIMLSAL